MDGCQPNCDGFVREVSRKGPTSAKTGQMWGTVENGITWATRRVERGGGVQI